MDLVGKKILVIHDVPTPRQKDRKLYIGIIVGCDPEIGICVAHPGMEDKPWCVLDGPLSPNGKYNILDNQKTLELNNFCLSQLKSGYISIPLIRKFLYKNYNRNLRTGFIKCPYSI